MNDNVQRCGHRDSYALQPFVNASDHAHQSDLPVRMGIYVGEEGVDRSLTVGIVGTKG